MNIVTPPYVGPRSPWVARNTGSVTDFIVHHSAGPKSQTPMEIEAFELGRGDNGMPYTWLIDDKGTVYTGRPPHAVSAATYGRNSESVAVCMIGNFELGDTGYNGPVSDAALASLVDLCILAHRQLPSIVRTIAHRDVALLFYPQDQGDYSTACCGSELYAYLPTLRAKVGAALNNHAA